MSDYDRIAVVDFGGQYAHLIATKVRRQRVLAEIRQPEDPVSAFEGMKGIILSGSPSLASGDEGGFNSDILDLDVPILGFCFGHQEIAKRYGGRVEHCRSEYGPARLEVTGGHAGVPGPARAADGLDEPPGHRRRGRRRLPRSGRVLRSRRHRPPLRRDRRRGTAPLRLPVPPRSRRHRARRGHAAQFRPRRLRLPRRLDDGAVRRGSDGRNPRGGRRPARSSCSPPAAWIPPCARVCSAKRSARTSSICCTWTTASCARTSRGSSSRNCTGSAWAATCTSWTPRIAFSRALDDGDRA